MRHAAWYSRRQRAHICRHSSVVPRIPNPLLSRYRDQICTEQEEKGRLTHGLMVIDKGRKQSLGWGRNIAACFI